MIGERRGEWNSMRRNATLWQYPVKKKALTKFYQLEDTVFCPVWPSNLTDDLEKSFHSNWWIKTGVTVRKRLSWVMTSATLTFDLWPWPFAWTSRLSLVITPENFTTIRRWEHSQKGVTDRRTDWTIGRAAWSQLKTHLLIYSDLLVVCAK